MICPRTIQSHYTCAQAKLKDIIEGTIAKIVNILQFLPIQYHVHNQNCSICESIQLVNLTYREGLKLSLQDTAPMQLLTV